MAYAPPAPPYVGPVAHSTAGNNKPIVRIVIHCTVGTDGSGAQGTAKYFRSAAASGSAHYLVDSDETLQCAYDSVICWHAPPNQHSIGIELCCSLSNQGKGHWTKPDHVAMLKRAARLTAELCLAYDVPNRKLTVDQVKAGDKGVCGHIDVSNAFHQSDHWDPGPYFPWSTFMSMVAAEIKAITGSTPGETPTPPQEDDVALTKQQETDIAQAGWLARQFGQGAQFETDLDGIDNIEAFVSKLATKTDLAALDGRLTALTNAVNALAAALPKA